MTEVWPRVDDRRVGVAARRRVETISVLGVRQDSLQRSVGGSFERGVDLLGRRLARTRGREVDERAGEDGRADRDAVELARRARAAPGRRPWRRRSRSGSRLTAAARARRRSLCGASCRRWSAVYAWIVVIRPCSTPIASCRTLANGARQFVVHDALEMTSCLSLSYASKLTPRTTVTSSPLAGAEITTFLAPAVEVLGGVVAVGEEAGRLDHDVGAEVAPRQLRRIALGEDWSSACRRR